MHLGRNCKSGSRKALGSPPTVVGLGRDHGGQHRAVHNFIPTPLGIQPVLKSMRSEVAGKPRKPGTAKPWNCTERVLRGVEYFLKTKKGGICDSSVVAA
jgi:hypothetical protein